MEIKGMIPTIMGIRIIESPTMEPDQFMLVPSPPPEIRAGGWESVCKWAATHSVIGYVGRNRVVPATLTIEEK